MLCPHCVWTCCWKLNGTSISPPPTRLPTWSELHPGRFRFESCLQERRPGARLQLLRVSALQSRQSCLQKCLREQEADTASCRGAEAGAQLGVFTADRRANNLLCSPGERHSAWQSLHALCVWCSRQIETKRHIFFFFFTYMSCGSERVRRAPQAELKPSHRIHGFPLRTQGSNDNTLYERNLNP